MSSSKATARPSISPTVPSPPPAAPSPLPGTQNGSSYIANVLFAAQGLRRCHSHRFFQRTRSTTSNRGPAQPVEPGACHPQLTDVLSIANLSCRPSKPKPAKCHISTKDHNGPKRPASAAKPTAASRRRAPLKSHNQASPRSPAECSSDSFGVHWDPRVKRGQRDVENLVPGEAGSTGATEPKRQTKSSRTAHSRRSQPTSRCVRVSEQ